MQYNDYIIFKMKQNIWNIISLSKKNISLQENKDPDMGLNGNYNLY